MQAAKAAAKPKLKKGGFARRVAVKRAAAKAPVRAPARAPAKAKAKPANKSYGSTITPDYFDARAKHAMCISPAPTLGNYTPINLIARESFTVTSTKGELLLLGLSTQGVALQRIEVNAGAANHGLVHKLEFSELLGDKPQQMRGSRKTLVIGASTANQTIAGSVFACMTPNTVEIAASTVVGDEATHIGATSVTALVNIAMSSPDSKQMSTAQFVRNPAFSLGFSSYTVGSEYQDYNSAAWNIGQMISDLRLGAMSTLIIYMPPLSSIQNYDVAVHEQLAARYPANHLLNGLSRRGSHWVPQAFGAANSRQSTFVMDHRGML